MNKLFSYLLIGYKSGDYYNRFESDFIEIDNVSLDQLIIIYKRYIDKGYDLKIYKIDNSLDTNNLIYDVIDKALKEFYEEKDKKKNQEAEENLKEYEYFLKLKAKYE